MDERWIRVRIVKRRENTPDPFPFRRRNELNPFRIEVRPERLL